MDRWDWVVVLGIVLVAVGVGFVYWPLALIVAGLGLGTLGVLGAIGERR